MRYKYVFLICSQKHYSRIHPEEKMGSMVPIKVENDEPSSEVFEVPGSLDIKIKKEIDEQAVSSIVNNDSEIPDKKLNLNRYDKNLNAKEGAKYTFVCDFCGKRFFKKDTLRVGIPSIVNHTLLLTNNKLNLQKHYARLHKNDKNKMLKKEKQDENCKPKLDTSYTHCPKVVIDDKEYICDICGEKFNKKLLLKVYLCDMGFFKSNN